MRLVPGQAPGEAADAVRRHLEARCPEGVRLTFNGIGGGSAASSLEPGHPLLVAAETVIMRTTGRRPVHTRLGGTIPITAIFKEMLGVDTLTFGFAKPDEDVHAPNEFFHLSSIPEGLTAWTLLLSELANRSPYTRRVAITLNVYGMPYRQQMLSGFANRADVRASNPLGRIPALVLDSGETLVDSATIIDHLDEVHGRDRALTPAAGADRRAVPKVAAMMMGACDKLLAAAYERNHRPAEKVHEPWRDDYIAQAANALAAVDAMPEPGNPPSAHRAPHAS
jgi:hypothetical protein